MKQLYDLDIVLPCYNPSSNFIEILISRFNELQQVYPDKLFRLIMSNDGATRNFEEQEQQNLRLALPNCLINENKVNQGKGAAVRAGIALSDAHFTIYTDIDMPYSLESMCQVIDRTFAHTDIVIAVRNMSYYSKLMPLRRMMSHGSQFMNRLFLGIPYTDTQGGLKGMSARARQVMLNTKINDFLFDTEFIVLAAKNKDFRIENVETNLRDGIFMSKMSVSVLFRESMNFFKIACSR